MSYLADVKKYLRVTHNQDDDLLNRLIESSTKECLRFLNVEVPPDMDAIEALSNISNDTFQGVVLMVQADYDGDPEKRERYLRAAQSLWQPYRQNIGA